MRSRFLKIVISFVLFLVITVSSTSGLLNVSSPKFDLLSQTTHIVDGDTFDIAAGYRIRLADVDTPEQGEYGYEQAGNYLNQMIFGKTVYLDVDDIYMWDTTGERLVCVVYVSYNVTHYLNVNKALLAKDYAVVWDHDNEFNPATWSLYVLKVSQDTIKNLLFVSAIFGVLSTVFLVIILRRGYGKVRQIVSKVKNGPE